MIETEKLSRQRALLVYAYKQMEMDLQNESVYAVTSALDAAAEAMLFCSEELAGVECNVDMPPDLSDVVNSSFNAPRQWAEQAISLTTDLAKVLHWAVEEGVKTKKLSSATTHYINTCGQMLILGLAFMGSGEFNGFNVDFAKHADRVIADLHRIDGGKFVASLAPKE